LAAGVSGRRVRLAMVVTANRSVACKVGSRQGRAPGELFGEIVSVIA